MKSPPVVLHNFTRHVLNAQASAIVPEGDTESTEIRVMITVPEGHVDPLVKELTETRLVMQDLMQEKLNGLKVYLIRNDTGTSLHHVHLSLKSAQDAVGKKYSWREFNVHGRYWTSASEYVITELEIR